VLIKYVDKGIDYMSPDEHKKEEDNKEKDNKEEDNKEKDNKEEDNKEEDNEEEDNDTEFHDAIQELIIYFKDLPPLIGPDPPSIPKDPMCGMVFLYLF
jgi:TATA-binding protein-associated factor Taf7